MRSWPAKHHSIRVLRAALLLAGVLAGSVAAPAAAAPLFSALPGELSEERYEPALLVLPSGKVLIAGGSKTAEVEPKKLTLIYSRTAELFDPATGKTERLEGASHELAQPLREPAYVLLPSGKALILGGYNSTSRELKTAQTFDPATNIFEALGGEMLEPRAGAVAVVLPSGKVFIAGGTNLNETTKKEESLRTAEIFDPAKGTFEKVKAEMGTPRYAPAVGLLPGGKVLIAGGYSQASELRSAEVFDPATGTFEKLAAEMTEARGELAYGTLPDGKILLAGGFGKEGSLGTAELFNPLTGAFEGIAALMLERRDGPAAGVLADGSVLIAGGAKEGGGLTSVERLRFPPTATTSTASAVTVTTATLLGSALAEVPTTVRFQYGTTSAYGATTPVQTLPAAIKTQGVAAAVSGLAAGTLYHYRLVAESPSGTSFGADATFATLPATEKRSPPPPPPPTPVLGAVSQSHTLWREPHRHPVHRNAPVGTTFTFTLNERASVTFTFTQLLPGRKVGRRCLAPTHGNRHHRACTRTRARGSVLVGGRRHKNTVAFKGQLSSGATLPTGSYTVQIVATNAKGRRSPPVRLSFRIVS